MQVAELVARERAGAERRLRRRTWFMIGAMAATLIASGIATYFGYNASLRAKSCAGSGGARKGPKGYRRGGDEEREGATGNRGTRDEGSEGSNANRGIPTGRGALQG